MLRKTLLLSLLCLMLAAKTEAAQFNSGEHAVSLIELYTSEGCSSCPPADRWLSSLKHQKGLWKNFVPAAFHVDYWDYLGWSDKFADKQYSQRQRQYAAENGESTVYTPGVRKNGREWRAWRRAALLDHTSPSLVGNLQLIVDDDGGFSSSFHALDDSQGMLKLTIAVLGLGLESEVSRGENSGKRLSHDFVVLGLTTIASGLPKAEANNLYEWHGRLPKASPAASKYAIAAWVSDGNSLKPIQVVAGEI